MATAAQRDRQIDAARKRVEKAQEKVTKAENDLAEQRRILRTQTERITWLQNMPVDDEPAGDEDEGDGAAETGQDGEDTPAL